MKLDAVKNGAQRFQHKLCHICHAPYTMDASKIFFREYVPWTTIELCDKGHIFGSTQPLIWADDDEIVNDEEAELRAAIASHKPLETYFHASSSSSSVTATQSTRRGYKITSYFKRRKVGNDDAK